MNGISNKRLRKVNSSAALCALSLLGCMQNATEFDELSNAIEGPDSSIDTDYLFPAVGFIGRSEDPKDLHCSASLIKNKDAPDHQAIIVTTALCANKATSKKISFEDEQYLWWNSDIQDIIMHPGYAMDIGRKSDHNIAAIITNHLPMVPPLQIETADYGIQEGYTVGYGGTPKSATQFWPTRRVVKSIFRWDSDIFKYRFAGDSQADQRDMGGLLVNSDKNTALGILAKMPNTEGVLDAVGLGTYPEAHADFIDAVGISRNHCKALAQKSCKQSNVCEWDPEPKPQRCKVHTVDPTVYHETWQSCEQHYSGNPDKCNSNLFCTWNLETEICAANDQIQILSFDPEWCQIDVQAELGSELQCVGPWKYPVSQPYHWLYDALRAIALAKYNGTAQSDPSRVIEFTRFFRTVVELLITRVPLLTVKEAYYQEEATKLLQNRRTEFLGDRTFQQATLQRLIDTLKKHRYPRRAE